MIEHFPADHNRYELTNGELTIDGQEPTRHELAFLLLYSRLLAARPAQTEVLATRWEIRAAFADTPEPDVRPDIVVAPRLLAVEVLSWRNNLMDLSTRMDTYARLGVRNYWMVDPIEPMLIAYELDDTGHYRRTAEVAGDEPLETTEPFPVRIVLTEPFGADPEKRAP